MGEPETAAEAEALEKFRELLPATGAIAWTNVNFRDREGRGNEVDAILLSMQGFFFLEFKGLHGTIQGNQFWWKHRKLNGHTIEVPNPLEATERKAKRFKGLLEYKIKGLRREGLKVPWARPVVVLHGRGSCIELRDVARHHLYGLDDFDVEGLPLLSTLINGTTSDNDPIDDNWLAATELLISEIGLTPRPKTRTVGKYVIEDATPLSEGPGWQDFKVRSPDVAKRELRLRTFTLPPKASDAELKRIWRQAKREYLLTVDLKHPGIVSAQELVSDPPAVTFPLDEGHRPLSDWLHEYGELLTLDERIQIIRELTETLQFAHKQGVHHRALSPSAVYVEERPDGRRLSIRDWQTGARDLDGEEGADTAYIGGTEVAPLAAQEDWIYLAPEAHKVAHPDGAAMDVYGLGALAFLVLTGAPPAQSIAELEQRLAAGGLDISTAMDAAPDDLVTLIDLATQRVVADRLASVDDFADLFADIETAMARGDAELEFEVEVDPLDAGTGALLDGGWRVVKPLGTGSTGRALLVSKEDDSTQEIVLKVAVEERWSDRLIAEAVVLGELDSRLIVKSLGGTVTVHDRTGILMEFAGEPNLGREIRDKGRLTLEQLDSFGNDLLEIGRYLASRGINHRDIKPDNLAFRPDPTDRRQRLTLFDFSLSREDISRLASGTRPYLDPFLGGKFGRLTYDSAAERFAIAVTLFEMATGSVPVWGDGQTDPADIDDEVFVAAEMFEGARPQDTAAFFQRALARDARSRFDSVEEMAQAWRKLFHATTTVEGVELTLEDLDAAAAIASGTTPLAESGLSHKAISAAQRLGAENVDEVMLLDPVRINQTAGIGIHIRREIQSRRREWIERLRRETWVEEAPETGRAIEDLRKALVPGANSKNRPAVALASALVRAQEWPSLAEVASDAEVDMVQVPAALEQLVRFWSKNPRLSEVAEEVVAILGASSSVATVDELSTALVARHGSRIEDAQARLAAALPVLWAVDQAQSNLLEDAELVLNRAEPEDPLIMGLGTLEGGEDPSTVMALVRELASLCDEATSAGAGLVTAPDSTALVSPYASEIGVPPSRLVRLAALASRNSDASTRGELYRRGLSAKVTIPRVLHGGGSLEIAEKSLRERVARRYPQAAALPPRPQLDDLVAQAVPGLVWNGTNFARAPEPSLLLPSATSTQWKEAADVELREVQRRLADSVRSRSGLVLAVAPRMFDSAIEWLALQFSAEVIDLSAALIRSAQHEAEVRGINWKFLLDVDASPQGVDRSRLDQFMREAFDGIWPAILDNARPVILTEAAMLARYGLVERLAPLVDLAQARPAARWIVVPRRAAAPRPMLDDVAIPLGADGWLDLPTGLWAT